MYSTPSMPYCVDCYFKRQNLGDAAKFHRGMLQMYRKQIKEWETVCIPSAQAEWTACSAITHLSSSLEARKNYIDALAEFLKLHDQLEDYKEKHTQHRRSLIKVNRGLKRFEKQVCWPCRTSWALA